MTKRTFDKIKAGLDDARAYLDGTADKRRYRVHVSETIDVKKIRARLGLSQQPLRRPTASRYRPCAIGNKAAAARNAAPASCSRSCRKSRKR